MNIEAIRARVHRVAHATISLNYRTQWNIPKSSYHAKRDILRIDKRISSCKVFVLFASPMIFESLVFLVKHRPRQGFGKC